MFKSSQSTSHFLTVMSDKIAAAFYKSGATQTVALDISKGFHKKWHPDLLYKLTSYGIQNGYLSLFCLSAGIDGFGWFWMGSLYTSTQLMLKLLKVPFLVLHIFYYT